MPPVHPLFNASARWLLRACVCECARALRDCQASADLNAEAVAEHMSRRLRGMAHMARSTTARVSRPARRQHTKNS
jgi:hypothetical protein